MLVRLPCLEPIMTTTTPPARPPVPSSAGPAVPSSLPDAEALGERIPAQAAELAGVRCRWRGGLVRGPEVHRSLAGLGPLGVPRCRPRTRARGPRPALDAPDRERVPGRPPFVFEGPGDLPGHRPVR